MMIINGINNDNDIKITHENFITFSLHKIIVRMAIKLMKLCVCVICTACRQQKTNNELETIRLITTTHFTGVFWEMIK